MGRRRLRLVPKDGVECFEVRSVLYFDSEGDAMVTYDIDSPNTGDGEVPIHEALGVMLYSALVMVLDRMESVE